MNTRGTANSPDAPARPAEPEAVYTLEIVAQLTGLSSQTILEYREQGLIAPVAEGAAAEPQFDDEALRTLRRIEHLRSACGMNLPGLKLVLGLLDELDRLRSEIRSRW
jgi:DNA-binding transcriptional MerR regulator